MKFVSLRKLMLASAALLLVPTAPGWAQDAPEEEEAEYDSSIIVTSMRVRQGGAQDIEHFRDAAENGNMPRPESLTVEGLMGEHDLTLPASAGCAQLLCVVGEAMPADLAGRRDKMLVGLGFTSNIEQGEWRREPLSLVAVVDKSGSMSGEPLDLVRRSLLQIVSQMRDGDRISIVLYGDTSHVHLAPTDFRGNRDAIEAAIRAIESAGSTNMEEGLEVGYATAHAEARRFKGNTRVMLFTDEQPNVGRVDAESFIGMAEAASKRGIGLTTIGVGVQFDATLAARVSSARGGNLFFISDEPSVASVFERKLDTMVSEVAHDLVLTLKPVSGYKIGGVFGVPDGMMEDAADGAISITVPSVFFSDNGGGIFVTLAKSSDRADLPAARIAPDKPLLQASATWNEAAQGKRGSSSLTVMPPAAAPSMALRKAHFLVDEYLALRDATRAFHVRNDPKKAYALLDGLAKRLASSGLEGMEKEVELVDLVLKQAALYSGYGGEQPGSERLAMLGRWEVVGIDGYEGVSPGDQLEFTSAREMRTYRKGAETPDESERFEVGSDRIRLVGSQLVVGYTAGGDRMTLFPDAGKAFDRGKTRREIALRRVE